MDRTPIDWEAIEREYRAGQLSIAEIARQNGISHPAILKRAKKQGWSRNLAQKVRDAVTEGLVTDTVTDESLSETVRIAAERGIRIVKEHRGDIKSARNIVRTLLDDLQEVSENIPEIEEDIQAETAGDQSGRRRQRMMSAINMPSRTACVLNLSAALKNIVGMERQAFNLGNDQADHGSILIATGVPRPDDAA